MKKIAAYRCFLSGFTLVEMLVVVAILGVIATVAIPVLSSNEPQKLNVATEEVANTLRFALAEAKRIDGIVLIDGKSTTGHLSLYLSNANAQLPPVAGTAVMNDPLTKRAYDLDVNSNAFSQGVVLVPLFYAGVGVPVAYTQLLIDCSVTTADCLLQVFDGPTVNKGALLANSGVQLSLDAQSVLVQMNEITGLVTLP